MHFVDAKSLLTRHGGMNLYRGCAHGCVYCDSRSKCYQFTHPFEDIEVKQNAPALLEDILKNRRRRIVISTGSMSDPYQPCEQELLLTRRCLELIAQYGEDPGMTREPAASQGYAVAEDSSYWDPAFTEGAMSIAEIGGISAPVYGSYGIHVIYYESDIPAGAVALEDVKAEIETLSLDEKISSTYNTTLDEWITSLNPVYHYENLAD